MYKSPSLSIHEARAKGADIVVRDRPSVPRQGIVHPVVKLQTDFVFALAQAQQLHKFKTYTLFDQLTWSNRIQTCLPHF